MNGNFIFLSDSMKGEKMSLVRENDVSDYLWVACHCEHSESDFRKTNLSVLRTGFKTPLHQSKRLLHCVCNDWLQKNTPQNNPQGILMF